MKVVVRELKELAEQYRISVFWEKIPKYENKIAYCDSPFYITMDVSLKNNRAEALCAFFHELGHVKCHRNGLWKTYHNHEPDSTNNKDILRKLVYTSLKAERWVDNFAAKELAKYDKRIKYDFPYSKVDTIIHFENSFIRPAKIKILKNKK